METHWRERCFPEEYEGGFLKSDIATEERISGKHPAEQQWIFLLDKHFGEFSDFLTNGPAPCDSCGIRGVNIVKVRRDGPGSDQFLFLVCGRHCNADAIRTLITEREAVA